MILARHLNVQGAFRKVLLVGYDYSNDDDLVKLKDRTRDPRAHLSSFGFCRKKKKIDFQVLVSVFGFLTYSNADPGTSIFLRTENLSITTIPTIENIKFVTLRVSEY